MPNTLAEHIIARLAARGVKRMFGVPGGGSSLALIEAGARADIQFVLARTETAAAIMAAATAELTGTPGVVLTGIGPGAASVVNGIAYASLERSPLLVITDCMHAPQSLHQVFDQQALFAALVRRSTRLAPTNAQTLDDLLDACLAIPGRAGDVAGPVHIDLSAPDANALLPCEPRAYQATPPAASASYSDLSAARTLLAAAERPVLLVGLEARKPAGQTTARALAQALQCPVLPTYKAKGVIADTSALCVGLFTNAAAESSVLHEADLIICFGLDPVEMIPQAWRYDAPVLDIALAPRQAFPFTQTCSLIMPAEKDLASLVSAARPGTWQQEQITVHRRTMHDALSLGTATLNAQTITQALLAAAPPGTRLAVDAGAHMFAAMAFWQADGRNTVLKSNGLSTMGYALPAALAFTFDEPTKPALCITGDGGMNMCVGELATAAALQANLVCAVLNDAALSLIDIKQQRDQRSPLGTRYAATDYASIAEGFGCRGLRANTIEQLAAVAPIAFAHPGPVVIDIEADASGYGDQLARLRG